jgi:hypothetical protein
VVIEELKNRKVIEKEKCKIAEVLFSNHFKCKWITCFSQKIDIDEMGLKKKKVWSKLGMGMVVYVL